MAILQAARGARINADGKPHVDGARDGSVQRREVDSIEERGCVRAVPAES
jgi:hypothetical protein